MKHRRRSHLPRRNHQGGVLLRLLVGFLLPVVVGAGFVFIGARAIVKGRQAADWPTVQGTVSVSQVVEKKQTKRVKKRQYTVTVYSPKVHYTYEIDGRRYTSGRIHFGPVPAAEHPDPAMEIVERYPAGSQVTVHYNPDDPAEAVLEPGGVTVANIAFVVLGTLALVAFPLAWLNRMRRRLRAVLR